MIPLNQLIPECLLALGAAFLLGNLAAYVRLRSAWREAKAAGLRSGKSQAKGRKPDRAGVPTKAKGAARAAAAGAAGTRGGTADKRSRAGGTSPEDTEGSPGAGAGSAGATGRSAGVKAAARPRSGTSGRVNGRVRGTTASKSLPSRTRVLANVVIGFLVTVAALAALIRG